jgi:hypothetical protein
MGVGTMSGPTASSKRQVPRHSEINEKLAGAILRRAQKRK